MNSYSQQKARSKLGMRANEPDSSSDEETHKTRPTKKVRRGLGKRLAKKYSGDSDNNISSDNKQTSNFTGKSMNRVNKKINEDIKKTVISANSNDDEIELIETLSSEDDDNHTGNKHPSPRVVMENIEDTTTMDSSSGTDTSYKVRVRPVKKVKQSSSSDDLFQSYSVGRPSSSTVDRSRQNPSTSSPILIARHKQLEVSKHMSEDSDSDITMVNESSDDNATQIPELSLRYISSASEDEDYPLNKHIKKKPDFKASSKTTGKYVKEKRKWKTCDNSELEDNSVDEDGESQPLFEGVDLSRPKQTPYSVKAVNHSDPFKFTSQTVSQKEVPGMDYKNWKETTGVPSIKAVKKTDVGDSDSTVESDDDTPIKDIITKRTSLSPGSDPKCGDLHKNLFQYEKPNVEGGWNLKTGETTIDYENNETTFDCGNNDTTVDYGNNDSTVVYGNNDTTVDYGNNDSTILINYGNNEIGGWDLKKDESTIIYPTKKRHNSSDKNKRATSSAAASADLSYTQNEDVIFLDNSDDEDIANSSVGIIILSSDEDEDDSQSQSTSITEDRNLDIREILSQHAFDDDYDDDDAQVTTNLINTCSFLMTQLVERKIKEKIELICKEITIFCNISFHQMCSMYNSESNNMCLTIEFSYIKTEHNNVQCRQ